MAPVVPKIYVRECLGNPIYFSAVMDDKAVSWALITAYLETLCPNCLKPFKLTPKTLFSCECSWTGTYDRLITRRAELVWIYTHRDFQHRGYASMVLDAIKSRSHRIITGMDSTEGGYGVCVKNGFVERNGILEWVNPGKRINNKPILI
jgi:GNAT superfamily N-acetyltransferase